jgi:hypothetical protein
VIQAAQKNLTVDHVPVGTNPRTRESRLFSSMGAYIQRSVATMARVYILYQPLKAFLALSAAFLVAALILFARFMYFYLVTRPAPSGHVQSLVVAGALAIMGVLIAVLGVVSDLTAMNRRLLEEILTNTRVVRFGRGANAERGARARQEPGEAGGPALHSVAGAAPRERRGGPDAS